MSLYSKSTRQEVHVKKESGRTANFAALFTIAAGSGVPLGVALKNLPLGIALGSFFGAAVGIGVYLTQLRTKPEGAIVSGSRWFLAIAMTGCLLLLAGTILYFGFLS
jgi:hypothetical protein